MQYRSLTGTAVGGSFICDAWELRVTGRCKTEDLDEPADTDIDDLCQRHEIVQALLRDRRDRTIDTRQVAPLQCKRTVWVLSQGSDFRGGTWFDDDQKVVWLVAAGHHRSSEPDDFFPYCKSIDAQQKLLPTTDDYESLIKERDARYIEAILIEAPFVLEQARESDGEVNARLADDTVAIAIEAADDLEEVTVAFDTRTVDFDHVPIILQALKAGTWDEATKMPSRDLEPFEYAYAILSSAHS